MRIGIDVGSLAGPIGGIGVYTQTLIEEIEKKNGWDLIPYSKSFSSIPFGSSLCALFRTKYFWKADLVHFPDIKVLFSTPPPVPYILTIHDVMPLQFPHLFPKKSRMLLRFLLPHYLRLARSVIAVSEQTKRDLLSFFPSIESKVCVIPCALPFEPLALCEEKEPYLLYIGSFEPRKNLSTLFAAYELLKQQGITHRLLIVGKEQRNQRIPQPIPKNVEIIGSISTKRKAQLLQKAALLVLPSLYEGFGLPLIEAMASGTPVITSNQGAARSVVGEAGLYANPLDPNDLATKMRMVLTDRTLAKNLTTKGLLQAAQYERVCVFAKLFELYTQIDSRFGF